MILVRYKHVLMKGNYALTVENVCYSVNAGTINNLIFSIRAYRLNNGSWTFVLVNIPVLQPTRL